MKIYFNTKAFDELPQKKLLTTTDIIEEADMAVLGAKGIDYDKCKNLKVIYRFGVGKENIPQSIFEKGHPRVYFPSEKAREILYESTSNFTCYLIIKILFSPYEGNVEKWIKHTRHYIGNMHLLIIGKGNIGSRVAKKMSNFLQVTTYDIRENSPQQLPSMLKNADIVSLHLPLTPDTKNMFDKEKLSWFKKGSILINTSRANIVNEDALYEFLQNDYLRTAAFDVFWEEPYHGKLKNLPPDKFIMTPHTASQTFEYINEGLNDILRIIKEYNL